MKKLNGFNNGRDTTDGVGGRPGIFEINLKQAFKPYGKYKAEERCVYLYSNESLEDENFIDLVRHHKIKIQLDLFDEGK